MSDRKQIILASIVPLSLAALLFIFGQFLVTSPCSQYFTQQDGAEVCMVEYSAIASEEYWFFVIGLLVLAILMPQFVVLRQYQNRRNKTESPSIFG